MKITLESKISSLQFKFLLKSNRCKISSKAKEIHAKARSQLITVAIYHKSQTHLRNLNVERKSSCYSLFLAVAQLSEQCFASITVCNLFMYVQTSFLRPHPFRFSRRSFGAHTIVAVKLSRLAQCHPQWTVSA